MEVTFDDPSIRFDDLFVTFDGDVLEDPDDGGGGGGGGDETPETAGLRVRNRRGLVLGDSTEHTVRGHNSTMKQGN